MPITQKAGKWVADYTDQFGKRHRHGFSTKREAKDHLVQVEADIRTNVYSPEAGKKKLKDVGLAFIKESEDRVKRREIDKTTHHNYASIIERYLIGLRDLRTQSHPERAGEFFAYPLGHLTLQQLSLPHIDKFREHLGERDLAPGTVKSILMVLRMVLEWAKMRGWVTINVADDGRKKRVRTDPDSDVQIPSKKTVVALCQDAPEEHRLIILFAATTGVRSSEQRAIQWKHVDLDKRQVRIERRINRFGQFGETKTRAGRRSIPIPPVLAAALVQHKATSQFSSGNDLVFASRTGNAQPHANWIKRVYDPAWRRLQAEAPEGVEVVRVKWHSLRHFAISTWIEQGLHVKRVQAWAGHSNAMMTLDTYGHLFESADSGDAIDTIAAQLWGD